MVRPIISHRKRLFSLMAVMNTKYNEVLETAKNAFQKYILNLTFELKPHLLYDHITITPPYDSAPSTHYSDCRPPEIAKREIWKFGAVYLTA
jgi:hypothetical protein